MKLLYFSSGPRHRVLEAILKAGHQIEKIYVTDPERWPKVRPTIALAEQYGIPLRVLPKREVVSLADDVRGRLCLSAGFAYLFPKETINAASLMLNVHGTLLPKYAGARTLNWVVARREASSGVTVHRIDQGVDTGPILLQRAFPLSPFETGVSLARKTLEFEPAVVVDALKMLETGQARFQNQDAQNVERLPDRTPEHSEVDPSKSLLELFSAIQAADPDHYPAHFYVHGQRVCIRLWRPDKPADEADLI